MLNTASREELTGIIRDFGEEKWAARIAEMICEHRDRKPMETTFDLVRAVDAAIPRAVRRQEDGHPARRTFQAIRIAVNRLSDKFNELPYVIKIFEIVIFDLNIGSYLIFPDNTTLSV